MPKDDALLDQLSTAVISGNIQEARDTAEAIIHGGFSVDKALDAMRDAMKRVGDKYERKEYFIVDVASSASAMREAFKVFEPHLKVKLPETAGTVVLGSLKGNVQSLGKDIVAATLRAAGLRVIDVGVDVPPAVFVDTAVTENAQIIGISISVDDTIPHLKDVVELLKRRNLAGRIKTMIGGQAVSQQTCSEYGVDAYAKDAWDCVRIVQQLLTQP